MKTPTDEFWRRVFHAILQECSHPTAETQKGCSETLHWRASPFVCHSVRLGATLGLLGDEDWCILCRRDPLQGPCALCLLQSTSLWHEAQTHRVFIVLPRFEKSHVL